ncbi:MFS transporter [Pradoshia eiseniae]|uniref:MFS transporter n=1 Tax=Pradoshia eiseniae TaxID=2064768 RepID=A0A2S7MVJ9_9BACI|nr:MFS transporter [Pradoshia eiseniae]
MLILMVNMFIAIGSFGLVIPILPDYLASIGEGGTAAGLMIAVFAGAQLVMSPIAGRWADQYGRRKMIIYGLIGLSLSALVFYLSNSIWILYFSRLLGGVGAAMLVPAIFAYIADITTLDQRAKGNSLISAAMSLGIVVGPGIGGYLAEIDLKLPLLVSAIVAFVAVIFSVILLKESRKPSDMEHMTGERESFFVSLASSVKKPYFVILLITLIMSLGLMAYESVLGLFVNDQYGASPKDIANMVTATGVVSVIAQLFIVDKIVNRFGESSVLILFIMVTALGYLISIFAGSYGAFFGITLIIFLGTSILRPVLNTLVSKMAGSEQGFAMGMNNAYMSIGNVLGPTIAGSLYDVNIIYPFVMGFAILLITLLLAYSWKRKGRFAVADS